MANIKSAEKRAKQAVKRRAHNMAARSRLRTSIKKVLNAVGAGKKDEAAKLLPGVHSAYDKAVKVGTITRPTANRKKSRLALSLKAAAK